MRGLPNHVVRGSNKRMTELQAHILLWQMKRARTDADKRLENALYLNERIREIPGLVPYQLSDGATRSAYHFYPMRYKKEHWDGLSRMKLRRALNAEGIPTYGGYGKQYQEGLIEDAINSRGYKRLFSAARLKSYREELYDLPQTDQLTGEGLMLFQHMLLAEKTDMDDIISAFQKLYDKRKELL